MPEANCRTMRPSSKREAGEIDSRRLLAFTSSITASNASAEAGAEAERLREKLRKLTEM